MILRRLEEPVGPTFSHVQAMGGRIRPHLNQISRGWRDLAHPSLWMGRALWSARPTSALAKSPRPAPHASFCETETLGHCRRPSWRTTETPTIHLELR